MHPEHSNSLEDLKFQGAPESTRDIYFITPNEASTNWHPGRNLVQYAQSAATHTDWFGWPIAPPPAFSEKERTNGLFTN